MTNENMPLGPSLIERLITKKQFAAKLGVTERTVDRWQLERVLPPGIRVTIGGTARYRETVADKWIASGCQLELPFSVPDEAGQ